MLRRLLLAAASLLLLAACVLWWRTAPRTPAVSARHAAPASTTALVDEAPYDTARQLAPLAATPQEQPLAQTALRVADHELALAFTAALRDVEVHPPALSDAAQAIQDRLRKSQAMLGTDQQRVADLTAQLARAAPPQKDALQDELDLAQSQFDLDQDEVEEADQDLLAAGGNPQRRIEALVQEHEAQVKARAAPGSAGAPTSGDGNGNTSGSAAAAMRGALAELREWLKLRAKQQQLAGAATASAATADALLEQRRALSSGVDSAKGAIAELAGHTKDARAGAPPASAAAATAPPPAPASIQAPASSSDGAGTRHAAATALLDQTRQIAANQKVLTLLDRQAADLRQLRGVYQQWFGVVAAQADLLLHELMLAAALVLGIVIVLSLFDGAVQRLFRNPKLDRRQVETLRSVTRIGARVIAVLAVVLILIGVPYQFGTVIGIVGAGLTVALKDFIVAFFGWLVLMGRNGIRLGDWVEINGVSGEVTELGMFHTVLLETGNWSDAGHPTGRRVTFTNSFAIEGHYFNFSTSGQWLWDELKVVVPAGQDPYPIVDAISTSVTEATAENAHQAELEWRRAVPSQQAKTFSGAPGVNLKPVVGGVEIGIRYLTRANERFQLRAKLYHSAVDLLGRKDPAAV